jgi:hypothetical protein
MLEYEAESHANILNYQIFERYIIHQSKSCTVTGLARPDYGFKNVSALAQEDLVD